MPASDHARRDPLSVSLILGLAHAGLFTLAVPPYSFMPAMPVSIALLTRMGLRARTASRGMLIAAVTQVVMWCVLHRWVIEVSAAGWIPLGVYLSCYGALYTGIIARLAHRSRTAGMPMTVGVPVVWVGLEYLRGAIVFHGYPWYLAGHVTIERPELAQSAAWFGAYFVSALVALFAGAIVDAIDRRWRIATTGVVTGAGIMVTAAVTNDPPEDAPVRHVMAVQTNVPQDNRMHWTPEQQLTDVASFIEMTRRGVDDADEQPDLIVWPETMMPGLGLEVQTLQLIQSRGDAHYARLVGALFDLQRSIDVPMLIGMSVFTNLRIEGEPEGTLAWDAQYNSAYVVDGPLPFERYDKVFLAPFGETMPYISAWPWLEARLLAFGARGMTFELDAATSITRLPFGTREDGATGMMATPICFEDTVPGVCRSMAFEAGVKRIDLLVNMSNDGWFGRNAGGRAAHAAAARFRCIELRTPMVRAANTGYSIGVDSSGNLIARLGEGRYGEHRVAGTVLARVTLDSRVPPYARIGDAWGWMCTAAVAVLLLIGGCGTRSPRRIDDEDTTVDSSTTTPRRT